jgi:gluconate 5-dehydrogenase
MFSLNNKTAIITGSGSGLGFTLARGLAQNGARVLLNGRNSHKLEAAVKKLREEDLDAYGYVFDVTDSKKVSEVIDEIAEKFGIPDILVNNAGIQYRAPLEEFPEEDWDRLLDINLKSAFIMAKSVAKGMISRRYGKIINICSVQSELGRPTIAPYAAAKGGLKMLTRAMAVEWARHNIQINGIAPGYFKTEITRALYENPEFDKWLCNRTPANRWGDPEELIGAAVFLSSDASSFVNGQVIFVDGGLVVGV